MTQTLTYDSYGRIASLKYPSGALLAYGYDSTGKISSMSINGSALITTTSYHPFGPIQGWTWGNGDNHIRLFDTNGRTSRLQGSDILDYSYDAAHRLTNIAANDPKYTQGYGYNALDQLISVAVATGGPIPGQSYVYDKLGNRTSQTIASTGSSFIIDANSNKLLSASGGVTRSNTYDAAGNLTADGTRTFTYNNAGRPTKIALATASVTAVYNGLGQRVSKATKTGTTYFAYDEAGHLAGEYSSKGALIQEVVWFGDLPVASLRAANTLASNDDELPDMEPIRLPEGATVTATAVKPYYLEPDHLGTPRKAIDPANKKVIWRWDSDAYGTTLPNEDPDGNGKKFTLNLRFPGQYFDVETGLNYNYFRDYDPATGMYTTSDPIGLLGGLNTFGYVAGNPVGLRDPMGLDFIWDQPSTKPSGAVYPLPYTQSNKPNSPWRKCIMKTQLPNGVPIPHSTICNGNSCSGYNGASFPSSQGGNGLPGTIVMDDPKSLPPQQCEDIYPKCRVYDMDVFNRCMSNSLEPNKNGDGKYSVPFYQQQVTLKLHTCFQGNQDIIDKCSKMACRN